MFASRGTQPKQRKAIVLATCLGCSSLSIVAGFPQIHDQCGTGTELQQVGCASQRPSHWEPPSPPRTQRKCLGVGVCLPLPLSAALPCPPFFLSSSRPLHTLLKQVQCIHTLQSVVSCVKPLYPPLPFSVSHTYLFYLPTIQIFRKRLPLKPTLEKKKHIEKDIMMLWLMVSEQYRLCIVIMMFIVKYFWTISHLSLKTWPWFSLNQELNEVIRLISFF